jgi:prohibitin 1
LLLCGRFLVEKAEQVKTASIISAEGDTEAADLLASAFAKAGEGLVSIQNFVF